MYESEARSYNSKALPKLFCNTNVEIIGTFENTFCSSDFKKVAF